MCQTCAFRVTSLSEMKRSHCVYGWVPQLFGFANVQHGGPRLFALFCASGSLRRVRGGAVAKVQLFEHCHRTIRVRSVRYHKLPKPHEWSAISDDRRGMRLGSKVEPQGSSQYSTNGAPERFGTTICIQQSRKSERRCSNCTVRIDLTSRAHALRSTSLRHLDQFENKGTCWDFWRKSL